MKMEHVEILKGVNPDLEVESRLLGGMSNYTYLVKDKEGKKYTFRIIGENGHHFTDYKSEEFNLNAIDSLAINSKTVYFETTTGVKLAEYVNGDVRYENINYKNVAKTLKKLHSSGIALATGYGHFQRLDAYEKLHSNFENEYYYLREQFEKLFDCRLKKHLIYPCHNDAQASNIIDAGYKCYLLDWEFAGMNDYIYDIASFGNRDFDMSITLLGCYEKDVEFEHLVRLYGWRMFQCLQWFNVASAKHKFGLSDKLGIDFEIAAKNYLNLSQEMFENLKRYL